MAGEGAVFDAQVRENDNVIISISYDGNLEEEIGASSEEEEGIDVEEILEETVEKEPESGVVIE